MKKYVFIDSAFFVFTTILLISCGRPQSDLNFDQGCIDRCTVGDTSFTFPSQSTDLSDSISLTDIDVKKSVPIRIYPRDYDNIRSIEVSPDHDLPIELPDEDNVLGLFKDKPVLWYSKKDFEVVVSNNFFSDISILNIFRLREGERSKICVLSKIDNSILAKDVFFFLIKSHLLKTYSHVQVELCLISLDRSKDDFYGLFEGIDTYYTNKRYQQKYKFKMELNLLSGEIHITRLSG